VPSQFAISIAMPILFYKLSTPRANTHLRHVIAQDILSLLNSAVRSAKLNAPGQSWVMSSVLNYGNPPWAALGSSRIDPYQMAMDIQATISKFEPRLAPASVKVRTRSETLRASRDSLYFDIQGQHQGQSEIFKMRLALDYQGASFTLPEDAL
jgi:predicted component of type VI protein secretion system